MPITTDTRDDGGILVTVEGPFVLDEVIRTNAYINQTLHKHRLVPYEVWDLSGCDLSAVPAGHFGRLEKVPGTNPDTLIAIVANDDFKFGLSRMWKGWGGDDFYESGIFRSLAEADAWLTAKRG